MGGYLRPDGTVLMPYWSPIMLFTSTTVQIFHLGIKVLFLRLDNGGYTGE